MEVALLIHPTIPELDQTAAALAFHRIAGAVHSHNEMATFAEAGVSDKE